jgi:hypothetical protein
MRTFDDMGVSESIGYILVFAIVLTGIAGIVFFGVNMLNDAKDRNNFQNVEQGFSVIQSDMKRVAVEKAPVKTTRIHVEGGAIVTNMTSGVVQVDFDGHTYRNTTGELTYRSSTGLKTISIQDGGLWKSYGTNMSDVLVTAPRIFSSPENNAIVINVLRLNGSAESFATVGTINMVMKYGGNKLYTYNASVPSDVTITVHTAYPNAWARYLSESIDSFVVTPVEVTDDHVKMTISGVSEVVISEHTIEMAPHFLTV